MPYNVMYPGVYCNTVARTRSRSTRSSSIVCAVRYILHTGLDTDIYEQNTTVGSY
jgi:hypothetical protein